MYYDVYSDIDVPFSAFLVLLNMAAGKREEIKHRYHLDSEFDDTAEKPMIHCLVIPVGGNLTIRIFTPL